MRCTNNTLSPNASVTDGENGTITIHKIGYGSDCRCGLNMRDLWVPIHEKVRLAVVRTATGPVWGQFPEMAAISQGAGASDPWAALVLADRLVTAKDRQDEAVAVLMGAVADAETAEEAKIRLRTLLLNAPPASGLDAGLCLGRFRP